MKTIDAIYKLREFGQPVLHTKEVAVILNISRSYASQLLRRLSHSNTIAPLKRGLWLIDKTVKRHPPANQDHQKLLIPLEDRLNCQFRIQP